MIEHAKAILVAAGDNPDSYDDEASILFAAAVKLVAAYTEQPEGDTLEGTLQAIDENLNPAYA